MKRRRLGWIRISSWPGGVGREKGRGGRGALFFVY